jgi:hypothetical protein
MTTKRERKNLLLFYFLTGTEKNSNELTKNYRTFYIQQLSLSTQKMGRGSEIQDSEKPIPDPRVKKAPDPGFGSATPVPSSFQKNSYLALRLGTT